MTRFAPALIVLAFPLALCAEDKKEDKQPTPSVLKSKEGKFTAVMPGKPTQKTNKVMTDIGELDLHAFLVDQGDRALVVMYSDYPAGSVGANTDKVLAGCIEGNVKALKGKLLTEDKITTGKAKFPGRDIRIEMPDKKNVYRARIYLAGDRLYQVVVLGPDEFTKGKVVEDFMKSFAIDE